MSAHTKGPWFVDPQFGFSIMAPDERGDSEPPWLVANVVEGLDGGVPESDANARLIAAAPEMYELIKELQEYMPDLERIQRVVAKVEGA